MNGVERVVVDLILGELVVLLPMVAFALARYVGKR
jgi:hypothetical protein